MVRRRVRITASIAFVMLLGFVLVAVSCKKSSPQPEKPQAASAPKVEVKADANAVAAPKPAVPAEPDVNVTAPKPAVTDTNNVAAVVKPADDMAPISIVLPKPQFVGTPPNVQGIKNLEKPLGKPREPFYAPRGTTNVAFKKPVKSSDEQPIIGEIEMITDGDKEATDGSYVELGPLKQHITIDLGASYNIYAVIIWHYHKQPRVYKDVIVQVADDPDFIKNVQTIFNNDDDNSSGLGAGKDRNYVETAEGKLIDAKGVAARYVRCYSNGNSANDLNNYIEVEVYGRP